MGNKIGVCCVKISLELRLHHDYYRLLACCILGFLGWLFGILLVIYLDFVMVYFALLLQ
jgi:hypothetical protein